MVHTIQKIYSYFRKRNNCIPTPQPCDGDEPGENTIKGASEYLPGQIQTTWTYKEQGTLNTCEWTCKLGHEQDEEPNSNECIKIDDSCEIKSFKASVLGDSNIVVEYSCFEEIEAELLFFDNNKIQIGQRLVTCKEERQQESFLVDEPQQVKVNFKSENCNLEKFVNILKPAQTSIPDNNIILIILIMLIVSIIIKSKKNN
jgi:hypothetical protein